MEGRAKRNEHGIKCRFSEKALFPQRAPDKPAALVDALLAHLLARPVQPATRETLLQLVSATPPAARVTEAVRLILAAPEYQMAYTTGGNHDKQNQSPAVRIPGRCERDRAVARAWLHR
jgi:hypothetical protein